ncbi:MAG: ABC transporter permease subunit, partial [Firmicutes bacterium]|nr:ABC transporter permease subunit [Bacillota bacterium]
FRVMFYLPGIISVVVLTMVFKQFIMPNGPLDGLLRSLGFNGISPRGLLGRSVTATKTIVFYCIWTGFGGAFMILGGAMSRIPLDVLESARLDGCGAFREAVQLILPLVWPTLATLLVFTMTGIFNASGPVLTLVNGDYDTSTLAYWIFNKVNGDQFGRGGGQYNIVSAAGLFFTFVLIPVTMLCRWLIEKVPDVEY